MNYSAEISVIVQYKDFHEIKDRRIFDACESLFTSGYPKHAYQMRNLWVELQAQKSLVNEFAEKAYALEEKLNALNKTEEKEKPLRYMSVKGLRVEGGPEPDNFKERDRKKAKEFYTFTPPPLKVEGAPIPEDMV